MQEKVLVVKIQHDYNTLSRAGQDGAFQVISVTGQLQGGNVIGFNIDPGAAFYSDDKVITELTSKYKEYDFSTADIEGDD